MPFRPVALALFSSALALIVALLFTSDRGRRAELFGLSASLFMAGVAHAGTARARVPILGSVAP
jgi:hypothetical protein